jgi:hypothetical protein
MGTAFRMLIVVIAVGALGVCLSEKELTSDPRLVDFATRYTAAWCSHAASNVAAFYSEYGSLTINDGAPAIGRKAITDAARTG